MYLCVLPCCQAQDQYRLRDLQYMDYVYALRCVQGTGIAGFGPKLKYISVTPIYEEAPQSELPTLIHHARPILWRRWNTSN
jgi:hypothetical protein